MARPILFATAALMAATWTAPAWARAAVVESARARSAAAALQDGGVDETAPSADHAARDAAHASEANRTSTAPPAGASAALPYVTRAAEPQRRNGSSARVPDAVLMQRRATL